VFEVYQREDCAGEGGVANESRKSRILLIHINLLHELIHVATYVGEHGHKVIFMIQRRSQVVTMLAYS
jgi:hypothetical protein